MVKRNDTSIVPRSAIASTRRPVLNRVQSKARNTPKSGALIPRRVFPRVASQVLAPSRKPDLKRRSERVVGQAIKAQATASSVAPTQGKAVSKISGSPTVPTSTAATQKQEFRFLLLNGDETWTLDTKVYRELMKLEGTSETAVENKKLKVPVDKEELILEIKSVRCFAQNDSDPNNRKFYTKLEIWSYHLKHEVKVVWEALEAKDEEEKEENKVAIEEQKLEDQVMVKTDEQHRLEMFRKRSSVANGHAKIEKLENEVVLKDQMLKQNIQLLKTKDEELKAKDEVIKAKDEVLKVKDEVLKAKDQEIQTKDQMIKSLDEIIKVMDGEYKDLRAESLDVIQKKDQEIEELRNRLARSNMNEATAGSQPTIKTEPAEDNRAQPRRVENMEEDRHEQEDRTGNQENRAPMRAREESGKVSNLLHRGDSVNDQLLPGVVKVEPR